MMFSFGERLGMFFPIEGGCLSAISVSIVLLLAVYRRLRRTIISWGRGRTRSPDASDNSIFLNLMLADFIQALGNLPTIKWMVNRAITPGHLCTAQAVVKQVGIVGVAMSSLAIAVHTFCVLVLRWNAPKYISKLVVLMIWIFAALVIGIPNIVHMKEQYYGNTGYWCWIVSQFKIEQIVTEYLWVWLAGLVMAILYPIMFVVMRGWFIVDNGVWYWHKNYNPPYLGQPAEESEAEKESKAIASLMLYYPAVYLICITPNTLSRWLTFSGFKVPYQYSLFANTLFSLSGLFNAVLFFLTRPELVVGPSHSAAVQVSAANPQGHSFHNGQELSGYSSQKFGSLPSRNPAPSDYVAPDPLEHSHSGQFQPQPGTYNAMLLQNVAGSSQRGPPRRMESDPGSNVTYISGEQSHGDFRSKVSAAPPVEEESYGYPPG